ncbi:MAG: hypothetical protein A3K12_06095 [Candidatus Rokubacteria bacterium RIFCSPLOWO2_12_FULL_71_19]|nr:MAG: hypothetical protein A3K12_06095 [Candidatus Rokubacteria bacterium RIFCSPLOWO2_12_FULL_71_19]
MMITISGVKAGLILAGAHAGLFLIGRLGQVWGWNLERLVLWLYPAGFYLESVVPPRSFSAELAGPVLGVLLSLGVMLPGRLSPLPFLVFSAAHLLGLGFAALAVLAMAAGSAEAWTLAALIRAALAIWDLALAALALGALALALHGGGLLLALASRGELGLASEPPPAGAGADAPGEASR